MVKTVSKFAAALACLSMGVSGAFAALPGHQPLPTGESLEEQRRCLAMTLYHEARAESDNGLAAVGHVVLNRVRHQGFPSTVCGVIHDGGESAPCQFGWYCDGRSDTPFETFEYERAERLADRILSGNIIDPTGGAISFHTIESSPVWAGEMERTITIGHHHFYRPVNEPTGDR